VRSATLPTRGGGEGGERSRSRSGEEVAGREGEWGETLQRGGD